MFNVYNVLLCSSSVSGASNASTSKPSKESETAAGSKSEKDFDLYDFRVESDEEQSADSRYVQLQCNGYQKSREETGVLFKQWKKEPVWPFFGCCFS